MLPNAIRPFFRHFVLIVPALLLLGIGWYVLRPSDSSSPTTPTEHTSARTSVATPPTGGNSAPAAALAAANRDTWQWVATQVQQDARAAASAGPLLPPDFLDRSVTGKTISFALPDGSKAEGSVEMIDRDAKGILFVQGRLTRPAPGSYFLQRQTVAGVAGPFVGNVRFDGKDDAWKIEPTADGQAARFVARKLDEVICANFEKMPAAAQADGDIEEAPQTHPTTIPTPLYQTVIPLQSLPGATGVVYLDFDGEPGPFPGWGTFDAAPSGASNTQVFEVWKMVCEDYQAFNLNITTDRKVFDNAASGRRQHIIITPTTTAAPGAGGVAYVGSFNWSDSRPCWAFYSTGKNSCEVISHEVGHTLGLSHDGRISPSEGYYGGHGSGDTGWAPIMGVGYYQKLSQWSKGEYLSANQTQDDLAIIVGNNNDVDYRADDASETLATAPYLEISATNTVTNEGIIERTGDVDAFRFVTSGGLATLNVNTVTSNPNLDLAAEVVAATAGTVMASNNPDLGINAAISVTLPAGEYLLKVRGTGRGDPLADGYTNYGCLGSYLISGSVVGGLKPDRFSLAENSANGTSVGTVAARASHGAATLTYAIASGNTGGAFAIDAATGGITVAATAALNYEALSLRWDDPATFQLFITITDSLNAGLNESIRVVVTVTNANEAPAMAAASATILEHTYPGTKVLKMAATDSDRFDFPTYSITAGNTGNVFAINAGTGQLSVAADLDVAANTVYNLSVKATDQGSPALSTTVTVPVTVVNITAGYLPGRLVRTYFENIGSGGTVANLTGNAKFPNNPDSEEFLSAFDGLAHGDNFGSMIRGYLIPPTTGSYQFWIASDDASELRLSTNATPASATVKASVAGYTSQYAWTANASQQSTAVTLTAGQPYYIEARHKEGGGGDHVAVAWSGPGLTRQVISGLYLAPYYQNYAPKITAATFTVRENALAGQPIGTVTANDVNAQDAFSAYTITAGNTGGVFAINPATGQLTVALGGLLDATTKPTYSLTIRTTDNGTPALNGTGTVTVTVSPAAGITQTGVVQEIWTGITGTAITGLTGNANYPNRPTLRRTLTGFDSVSDYADNYGSRIRAKFVPPVSGDYKFYVSGDDESRLLFSANATGSGAAQIASVSGYSSHNEWTKFTSQTSAVKTLVAGQAVYLETLHKEGGGGDHISVGYTSPDTTTITVIPGSLLQPFNLNGAPAFSPTSYTFNLNGGTATPGTLIGTPTAIDPNGESLVYAILSGNGTGAFAINAATGALTVANPALLTSGDTTLQLAAQDGGLAAVYPLASATATAVIRVTGLNAPPVFTANPIVKPAATENVAYNQTLAGSVTDPTPGETLTFSKTSGPAWLAVATSGVLSGTPADANTGTNSFGIRVTDSAGGFAEATLNLTVTGVNHPPVFSVDPISASLLIDTPLAGTVTATDADPTETLTYSKVSGPAWLSVAANGSFAGTPSAGTAGANVFIVRVTDPTGLFDEATLNVMVVGSPTWLNPTGGSWPTAGNWFAGVNANGTDTTADFSTLDLTANATVTLDGSRTIGHLIFGDASPSHAWTLATGTAGPLSLNVTTGAPTITVLNQSTTISAVLAGSKGFSKAGNGTLVLAGTGLYTGPTSVLGGTLIVNGNLGNSAVAVAASATLGGTGGLRGAISLDGTLAPGNSGIGNLTSQSGLTLNGASSINWEVADWNGAGGTGFDTITAANLTVGATAANPVVIRLSQRALANFSETGKAFTLIETVGPITGFDSAKFTVDATGFTAGAGTWSIREAGNRLELAYTRPNAAPAFPAGSLAEAATEDTPFTGQLAATDPDAGDTLTYSLVSGPAWLTIAGNGALSGTPTNENVGANSFTVQVTDADNAAATAVLTITVANTNDAPAFPVESLAETATEDTPFTGQLAATDPDAGDTLTYSLVSGPAWLTVAGSGALSGMPTNENVGANSFTVQVTDAANATATAVLTITVANTNDAPAFPVESLAETATEDTPFTGQLAATDPDAGDTLTYSLVSGPAWLTVAGSGALSGMPTNENVGANSFTVQVTDAANATATAVLTITVANTNDAPAFPVEPLTETATEDTPFTGQLAATDPDAGDTLTYSLVSGPAWLAVSTTGILSGTPTNENVGPNTFTVQVTDAANASATAVLTITVANANDAPAFPVEPLAEVATEDTPFIGQLAATDPDAGDTLTYSLVSGPAWLTVAGNGALSGTPTNESVGANSFTVQVTDADNAATTAVLTITVANTNDAPAFPVEPLAEAATEDTPFTGQLAATDPDAGDTLTYSLVSGPAWLTVSTTGILSGTPTNENVGPNTFTVQVTDAANASATAVLTITVANANDAPAFPVEPLAETATEDTPFTGQLAATDPDAGDTLTYSLVSGPAWLAVSNTGILSGTPTNESVGANSFTVQVTDADNAATTAVLTITVANTNDAPAFPVEPLTETATEDTPFTGQLAATDPDAGDTLTYSLVSGPAWLAVSTTGILSGTPTNENVGPNTFTVQVTDAANASATAVLTITVANTNDAPAFTSSTITGLPGAQDVVYAGTLAGTATDEDAAEILTYSKVNGPTWLAIAADGALTGTPGPDDTGLQTFTVQVTDAAHASATATLEIDVAAAISSDANGNDILDTWETAMFGNAAPGNNAATDDPDGDGFTSLMEYALNTHPLQANASPVTDDFVIVDGARYLRLTVTKNPVATNLIYTVETGDGLSDWSATTTQIETATATQLVVRDTVAQAAASRRFIRLKVAVKP